MQLRLNFAGLGIGPLAAALHHHGRRAKQLLQLYLRRPRMRIAFDAQRQSLG